MPDPKPTKEQMRHRLECIRAECRSTAGDEYECGFCKVEAECDAICALIEKSGKTIILNLETGTIRWEWEPAAKTLIESPPQAGDQRGKMEILRHPDGWWLSIVAPSGKKAMFNLGSIHRPVGIITDVLEEMIQAPASPQASGQGEECPECGATIEQITCPECKNVFEVGPAPAPSQASGQTDNNAGSVKGVATPNPPSQGIGSDSLAGENPHPGSPSPAPPEVEEAMKRVAMWYRRYSEALAALGGTPLAEDLMAVATIRAALGKRSVSIERIKHWFPCRCEPAWTDRGLTMPGCDFHDTCWRDLLDELGISVEDKP